MAAKVAGSLVTTVKAKSETRYQVRRLDRKGRKRNYSA